MLLSWRSHLLFLLLCAAAGTLASATPVDTTPSPEPAANTTTHEPTTPPLHREVVVIDVTANTTSVVSIPVAAEPGNLTAADAQLLDAAHRLRCLTDQKANIFLLVHLNRNWRHKLNFVHQFLSFTYDQASTNVAIVFFNAFTNILATFGPGPLATKTELLTALALVQTTMERDEKAAVSEHWVYFQLDDALNACFRYARLFLHQFSLDARPSVLLTYFDYGAVMHEPTIDAAAHIMRQPDSPFRASLSLLQWASGLPIPGAWTRVSEFLSSWPGFQLTGSSEASLLVQLGGVAGILCNRTRTG